MIKNRKIFTNLRIGYIIRPQIHPRQKFSRPKKNLTNVGCLNNGLNIFLAMIDSKKKSTNGKGIKGSNVSSKEPFAIFALCLSNEFNYCLRLRCSPSTPISQTDNTADPPASHPLHPLQSLHSLHQKV